MSFFILIWLPILLMPVNNNIEDEHNNENRLKAKLPTFSIKHPFGIILETDKYVKDNFAFRSTLSNVYFLIKTDIFNVDPLPNKVVKGKNGWMFLGNSEQNVFNESIGSIDHSSADIESICKKIIEMKEFCDSLNIKFYFAVAPNKHSFYKEYLPIKPSERPKRLELVKNLLKTNWNFDVIDLREYMTQAKDSLRLFYKTDSHWNEYGAFLGTQKLLDVIKQDFSIEPLEIEEFQIDTLFNAQMDLTKMLNLQMSEQHYKFKYIGSLAIPDIEKINIDNQKIDYHLKSYGNNYSTSSVVFRDSFFNQMLNFFRFATGKNDYIWTTSFNKKIVLESRPDFVVFEIVERNLGSIDVE